MGNGGRTAEEAFSLSTANGSQTLRMTVNGREVDPGDYIPRGDAQSLPTIRLPASHGATQQTFVGIAMDIDAPFRSFNRLGPILHWMQSDLKASGDGELRPTSAAAGDGANNTAKDFIADYIGPAPPPFAAPHRYVFFIYEQPATFDASKFRVAEQGKHYPELKRMWFDADDFAKSAGLGTMIAANYFTSN